MKSLNELRAQWIRERMERELQSSPFKPNEEATKAFARNAGSKRASVMGHGDPGRFNTHG